MDATGPKKCIKSQADMPRFKNSKSHAIIMDFVAQCVESVDGLPRSTVVDTHTPPPHVTAVCKLLGILRAKVAEIPLHDMKSQRFGNKAFRDFQNWLIENVDKLLAELLEIPRETNVSDERRALYIREMKAYLLDSFGNIQRIDFGTGHELHFLIFMMIYRSYALEVKEKCSTENSLTCLIMFAFWEYVEFMRHLQGHYKLEPAGSHGVWGLDDYHHLPFIFGASQLKKSDQEIPPKTITNASVVSQHRSEYFYYSMIAWINENKFGPFHEHSSVLYNVSGLDSWSRICIGMQKMFDGEVLSKFAIVQHLLFGEFLPW